MKYAKLPPNKQVQNFVWNQNAKLGSGSFGSVYLGHDINRSQDPNGDLVAIKIIAKNSLKDEYVMEALKKEIQVMQTLFGENIVQFISIHESLNNIYIMQEFCEQGDLRSYLTKSGPLQEEIGSRFLYDIVSGLSIMVKNNIMHRDLKPENILLRDDKLKLADFGFSRFVADMQNKVIFFFA